MDYQEIVLKDFLFKIISLSGIDSLSNICSKLERTEVPAVANNAT